MIRLIYFTLFTAIIATIAIFISQDTGTVSINYLGYEITTSVLFLIISIIIFMILIHFFVIKPISYFSRRRKVKIEDSKNTFLYAKALAAAAREDTKEFNRNLRKLWFSLKPVAKDATLVLETMVAKHYNQEENLLKALDKLMLNPEFSDFAYKEKVDFFRKKKDDKSALTFAIEAYNVSKSNWVYSDIVELEIKAGSFEKAEEYLEEGYKNKAIEKSKYSKLKSIILLMIAELPYKQQEKEKLLSEAHKLNPAHTVIAEKLASFYIDMKKYKKAQAIIEESFKLYPALPLYRSYVLSLKEMADVDKLKMVEKLVANLDNDTRTFIMADIYMKISLWGQAWNELKKYIENHELTPALCKMLSRVEKFSGMQYHISECVVVGSDEHTFDTWICDDCGYVSVNGYKAQCDNCGNIGTISWKPAA